jgi:hypothetical protein
VPLDPNSDSCGLCKRRDAGDNVDDSDVDTSAGLAVGEIAGFCREDFLAVIQKYVEHPVTGWDDAWWERVRHGREAQRVVLLVHFFVAKTATSGIAAFIEGLGENAPWYDETEALFRSIGAKRALKYVQEARSCFPSRHVPTSPDERESILASGVVEDCLTTCDDTHAESADVDAIDALRRYVERHESEFDAIRRKPRRQPLGKARNRTRRR